MKRREKKVTLNRETLRRLTAPEMQDARGGDTPYPTYSFGCPSIILECSVG